MIDVYKMMKERCLMHDYIKGNGWLITSLVFIHVFSWGGFWISTITDEGNYWVVLFNAAHYAIGVVDVIMCALLFMFLFYKLIVFSANFFNNGNRNIIEK